ncbi:hypothetical protein [Fulvivirga ulvae]|uniref:hypothetical protein n=1 Tax=Fulvivirga ulvae TaxID=2904245 RepID=UPI00351E8E5A
MSFREHKLAPFKFMRVHKSSLVNLESQATGFSYLTQRLYRVLIKKHSPVNSLNCND